MGKTEFLTKDLTPAAEKKGLHSRFTAIFVQEDQDPAGRHCGSNYRMLGASSMSLQR